MLYLKGVLALPPRSQRGVAAVEFAVILPILLVLLAFPIFYARVFMHYTVIQKAAHDAAVYYASIPVAEMNTQNRSFGAEKLAGSIVAAEVSELNPGEGAIPMVQISCDDGPCGEPNPKEVTVHVRVRMVDDFFSAFTWESGGTSGIRLEAKVTVPYLGN